MNVLVINHYACNKGDRAILTFIARELHRNGVTKVTISAHDRRYWPDLAQLDGAPQFVPWGWNVESRPLDRILPVARLARDGVLFRGAYSLVARLVTGAARPRWAGLLACRPFRSALARADLVISTGGHHITSLLSPDAVSQQLYDMGVSVLAGKPVALWSQSIGPLVFANAVNRAYVASLLRQVREVVVRDDPSRIALDSLGVPSGQVRQTAESVFGLEDLLGATAVPSVRPPVVGIAVYCAQSRTSEEWDDYTAAIAGLVDHVASRGFRSRFFPMELRGTGSDDREAIARVIARVRAPGVCDVLGKDLGTRDHLAAVSECRLFVGHKTHSVVFALATGTPVIALVYHPKTRDFLRQFGLEDFCLSDGAPLRQRLREVTDLALANLARIGERVRTRSKELGRQARGDFAAMIGRFREDGSLRPRAA
jgi:polysaccharide pyruvyl transferase WcaK-like protein